MANKNNFSFNSINKRKCDDSLKDEDSIDDEMDHTEDLDADYFEKELLELLDRKLNENTTTIQTMLRLHIQEMSSLLHSLHKELVKIPELQIK